MASSAGRDEPSPPAPRLSERPNPPPGAGGAPPEAAGGLPSAPIVGAIRSLGTTGGAVPRAEGAPALGELNGGDAPEPAGGGFGGRSVVSGESSSGGSSGLVGRLIRPH
eukprot:3278341-Prymnesium_polylepis.1